MVVHRVRFASVFLLASLCAYAQIATTTSLVGTVTDASGKTVPDARVTATNQGTSDKYTATTNEQGYYNFPFVSIGNYELTIEQPGFQVSPAFRSTLTRSFARTWFSRSEM
jgi:hypothetical protein